MIIIRVAESLGSRQHVLHLLREKNSKKVQREGYSTEAVPGWKENLYVSKINTLPPPRDSWRNTDPGETQAGSRGAGNVG